MINKKKGCLVLNIISLFFMIGLLIFPMSVQAYNNLIINLESPKESELFNGNDLNLIGTVDSKERLKLIEIYLNNEKIGQAKTETSVNKDSSYLTNFEYKKDMSNIKNGEYLLKIVAIDENDNKEEKSLKIYVKNQQEQTIQDNVLKNEENNTLTNNTYKETKALSVPLSGKATIQTYDIMLGDQYITNGKLASGKTYTIKGYASSPNGVLYEFWVKDVSTGVWTKIRDYKEDRCANWTPSKNGQYVIAVNVKDKYSNTSMDGRVEKTFTVETQSGKATIQTYDIMLGDQYITNGKLASGKTYTIKGYASSPNGVLYEFWVKDVSTGVWTKIRDYKEDRYANWTPNKSGQYIIAVNVKDKYSNASVDGKVEKNFNVDYNSGKATIQTYDIMLDNQYVTSYQLQIGKTYTIKGYASSTNRVLYEFWVKDLNTGTLTKIREYKEDRYASWTPTKSGKYTIIVNVKDIFSSDIFDSKVEKTFTVLSNSGFKTVIVDAGHGGYDSGAVGPTGIKEKDVTLKVALKLGRILENNGVKVIYTRTSDNVSWPSNESQDLEARVSIANSNNTDLYVSIHANSFNGSAYGTETYYYNGSAKGKEAAEAVQKELINAIGLYDRGAKTAGYYVLKNTISPSILVELGFIDNRNEEILLNSDWFQQKCAEAIAKGILGTSFM